MNNRISVFFVVLLGFPLMSAGLGQTPRNKISTEQVRRFIFERENLVNECAGQEPLGRFDVEYYDFDGDGREEVIVNAMTCVMGNGGNYVLSVYSLNKGKLAEWPIECLGTDETTTYCQKVVFARGGGHLTLWVPLYNEGDSGAGPTGGTRRVTYRFSKLEKRFEIFDTEVLVK